MILDTSAIIAIIKSEAEAARFVDLIAEAVARGDPLRISAGTLLEVWIVLDGGRETTAARRTARLLQQFGVIIDDVGRQDVDAARDGYRRFGKGNHAARLNFGDCFAYALAARTGEPLLFKGRDFALTDVRPAA